MASTGNGEFYIDGLAQDCSILYFALSPGSWITLESTMPAHKLIIDNSAACSTAFWAYNKKTSTFRIRSTAFMRGNHRTVGLFSITGPVDFPC